MECRRCGEIIEREDTRYCPRCGNALFKNESKSTAKTIFIIVAVLVLAFIAYTKLVDNDNDSVISRNQQYINFVKEGTPNDYPNAKYGEAFERFFSNPKWNYFESDTHKDVVEFTGGCVYLDTEVTARIQFVLDIENGTFTTEYLAFNEVPQNELILWALIEKVFEDYK